VGGVFEVTSYVSATQITATVPASQLTSGNQLSIIAVNGTSSSGSGAAVNLVVNNPAPTISLIVPSTFSTGASATTIAVTGTGFVPTTTVLVGGSLRSTTYVSATQVNVILTVADLASAGTLSITATNPSPGGGTSSAASLPVNNAVPGTITLSPTTLPTGAAAATTVTVNGTNFVQGSTVQVGTTARATTFVSATQVTFQLTVADQATAARLNITVVNPVPGGGTSPIAVLTVAAPTPTPVITSVSPTQLLVGSAASSIGVFGTNMTSTSVVQWNGSPLATTYVVSSFYGNYLIGLVPANLLTTAGTATITVNSPTSTPSLSNPVTATIINPPAPTLTQLSVAAVPINTSTAVTLYGTNFTSKSTATINGANLPVTYVNSTQLTANIPASAVPLPGNYTISVTQPAPGGGTSAPLSFTAYIGIVNNSAVFNPVNGLFYVSVPSSAGAPYADSVVSVDPATGALGTPIAVGSEPDRMALTADGKFLWVALDGASAVRKVDLTTGTVGPQFSLGGNTGIYATPPTIYSLVALPGATDSVVVGTTSNYSSPSLAIFDSGVLRGTSVNGYSYNTANALLADGTRSEIYAASSSSYNTYTYGPTGLTPKAASNSGSYSSYSNDDLQIAGGRLYTDNGRVYDPESGSLLGTFYSTGTTVASGPTVADTTLGKAFMLDTTAAYSSTYNQIQIFNLIDFTTVAQTIPINVAYNSSTGSSAASRLVRWGTNGLAFRTSAGIYSLRSNLVKDLSSTTADLGVTLAASGGTTTGSTSTFTATVTNVGPTAATNIVLSATPPSIGALTAATSAAGTCSLSNGISCNLGGLASGGSAIATFTVAQAAAGGSTLTVQVSGSENDPVLSNNTASTTATITGSAFNVAPTLTSISPAAILSGSADTTITLTGSGFNSGSTVMLDGVALSTSAATTTQITATVPAPKLAAMGWSKVSVTNATPGGGSSAVLPLTVYSVMTIGVNHILYEPFSRKIYASVGSGSSSVVGNSVAAITPDTVSIGTPVNIGSQPTKMAISDDGNILYSLLGGANSVARFNLNTQQTEFTFTPTVTNYGGSTTGFRDLAIATGSETVLAVDFGYTSGLGLFDVNPVAKTATMRGAGTGIYTGTSLQFYDPNTLYLFNSDTWSTLDRYPITSAGFVYNTSHISSTLLHFGSFKLVGKLAFADAGGLADVTTSPATQLGVYTPIQQYGSTQKVAPDTSLSRVFFLTNTSNTSNYYSSPDGIVVYDQNSFLPQNTVPLNMSTIEGTTSFTGVDLIRWGQDGLAALTSTGHIYLLRGAAVVPQLLNANSAAVLTSSSATAITHGAGNTVLTLTGSSFVPGVAVTWNGSYRTTTIVDATHVTVFIPATDLANSGTGSLVATNPGASASSTLTITIN
jgi:hypothetical protein